MDTDNVNATWSDALDRHSIAANAYVATASAIQPDAWSTPVASEKWSPAQITEHLNRTYQVVLDQLRGGAGIRIRTPWLLRMVLRGTVLRSIFKRRRLPKGAKAPSEVMPTDVDENQSEALERFARLAGEFGEEVSLRRGETELRLTHHIFGEIGLLPGIDFVAIHVEHHHRQINPRAKAAGQS